MWIFLFSWLSVAFAEPSFHSLFSFLAYVGGYAAFWVALVRIKGRQKRFIVASTWFSLVQAVQLSWFVTFEYHGIYILIVYFTLCLLLGLQFGFLTLFLPKEGEKMGYARCLQMASFWTLMEWIRLFAFCGFAFSPVGLVLTASKIPLQFASVVGILGLSFWVILVNALAFRALLQKTGYLTWGVFAVIPVIYGVCHLHYHTQKLQNAPFWKVALVQTGLKPEQKNLHIARWDQYISPLEQWEKILSYLPQEEIVDFIVLPEAAVPNNRYSLEQVIKLFRRKYGNSIDDHFPLFSPYIVGEIFVTNAFFAKTLANYYSSEVIIGLDDADEDKSYNAAFHYYPSSSKFDRYEKQVLVPLGEYLPLSFLRPLVERYGISDFFTHGDVSKVFEGKTPLSISICYEECFSHIIRKGRELGANLLVNVTNDAYYPNTKLPLVHFSLGKVRAIENGVPLIRSCNTGITGCVDSLGNVKKFVDENEKSEWVKGAFIENVSQYHFRTGFMLWGNYLCLGISAIILILGARKSFLSKRKKLKIS